MRKWFSIVMIVSVFGILLIGLIVNRRSGLFELTETMKVDLGKPYILPRLGYAYDALEPYIDAKTMQIHYTKHHQAYVDNLNKTLKDYPNLLGLPLEYLLTHLNQVPKEIRTDVKNFAGGNYNHTIFWKMMSPSESKPSKVIEDEIKKYFGSFEEFKEKFNTVARKVFGSGYAWLCIDSNGKMIILESKDQDTPLTDGFIPILGIDVWEHAYYLKYQNRRVDFVDAWWNVVNWKQVQENYDNALKKFGIKK